MIQYLKRKKIKRRKRKKKNKKKLLKIMMNGQNWETKDGHFTRYFIILKNPKITKILMMIIMGVKVY